MKTLNTNWLDKCNLCESILIDVKTENKDSKVNELDNVTCHKCGNTGYVDFYSGVPFVCWDELSEDEVKYNKLKLRYDRAIELLMKSDYGDADYLRKYGAID